MTNVVKLHTLDDEDADYQEFLTSLKDDNSNAVYLIEKKDGTLTVGCNFEKRRDLVYAIYQLQNLAQGLAAGGDSE